MDIEKNFFLICENALLDSQRKLTLVNVFDVLNTKSVPALHAQLYLVANFLVKKSFRAKDLKVSFSIVSPSGNELLKKAPVISKRAIKDKNSGFIVKMNNIVFPEFGKYVVRLSVNGKEIASSTLIVNKITNRHVN